MANVSERVNQVIKTEVKKFTLKTFQAFCWTSSSIDDDFETIVAKFFGCASSEMHNDELILIDDEGRTRWARNEEIDRFLDYVSANYFGLIENKIVSKTDLSALSELKLPEKVVQAIEGEVKFCSGVLEVLDHDVRIVTRQSSSALHYLYLCIRGDDQTLLYLMCIDWIDYLSDSTEDLGTIHVSRFHKCDFNRFKKLLPELF